MSNIWTTQDLGTVAISVAKLSLGSHGRNPLQRETRLGEQFLTANRTTFKLYNVVGSLVPTTTGVCVNLRAGSQIGAMALLAPDTGKPDFGLVIRPRFGWRGVGALLSEVGAKLIPQMPRLPALPRSEHEVPKWVLAAVVLTRLEALLLEPQRKFLSTQVDVSIPRGRIVWNEYVTRCVSRCMPDSIPCAFSELKEDPVLLGAVHMAVLAQLNSLQQVKTDSILVARLLARYESLRQRVSAHAPSWNVLRRAQSTRLIASTMSDALEAMAWTHEQRGLAGQADFSGLPWKLSMEEVFEARVEALAREIARRSGGVVRTGRLRETQRALRWVPAYSGSQRTLLPDVEIVSERQTIVFDAKYKSHWEEIDSSGWDGTADAVREAHRADLMQILAYGATASSDKVVCVLVYPCKLETWNSLSDRGRTMHTATVSVGSRSLSLVLAAIPFEKQLVELAAGFIVRLSAPN